MEEAYMLKIDNDDYELDPSNHRGFYYQLFCRRANGYLSIDPSYNKEATVIKLEICPNRGEHIGKFIFYFHHRVTVY